MYYVQFKFDFVELKFRKFQTLHFRQRIKRIILIYHAARRCISLMPQAATNGIEWLHSVFVFIRCTFRCIVHCINSSYSKYWLRRAKGSLLKKASETSMYLFFFWELKELEGVKADTLLTALFLAFGVVCYPI